MSSRDRALHRLAWTCFLLAALILILTAALEGRACADPLVITSVKSHVYVLGPAVILIMSDSEPPHHGERPGHGDERDCTPIGFVWPVTSPEPIPIYPRGCRIPRFVTHAGRGRP
jgi:hypothetical protein